MRLILSNLQSEKLTTLMLPLRQMDPPVQDHFILDPPAHDPPTQELRNQEIQ